MGTVDATIPVFQERPVATAAENTSVTFHNLLEIASVAILLRVVFFLVVSFHFHYSFHQWAMRDDGSSYIAYARALLGDSSQLTPYDQRVFPGYPALIALVHCTGVSFESAAVGLDWISAGLVAAMAAALFRDRRIGWAMTCLPLQYFINSSLPMSETPMLALTLGGLLIANRVGSGGGILLGLAGLVRPMACFAVGGQFIRDIAARRLRRAITTSALAGAVVLFGILALHHWTGDAFRGAKVYANAPNTYNGHLIEWPFHSLIHESLRPQVNGARILYIWIHVVITLVGLALVSIACIRFGRNADGRNWLAAPWLLGNTLFVLCIGSYWGFNHFPRFTIPALPALFWAVRNFLPRRRMYWYGIASGILVAASCVILHDFIVPD